jgi:hypothetical protein
MLENPFLEFKIEFDKQPEAENSGGIFGSLTAALDTVNQLISGEYYFHVGAIPEIVKKRFLELHGLDLRTEVLTIIENNRVGDGDSSVLVSKDYLSIRSVGAYYAANADNLCLRIPLIWIENIELQGDLIYLTIKIPEFDSYEIQINVSSFCDPEIDWHIQKLPLFILSLKKHIETQKSKSNSQNGFGHYLAQTQLAIDNSNLTDASAYLDKAKENLVGLFFGIYNEHHEFLISETEYKTKSGGFFNVYEKYLPLKDFLRKGNPILAIAKRAILECEAVQSKIDLLQGRSYDSIYRITALKSHDEFQSDKNLKLIFENHIKFFRKNFIDIPIEKRKILLYTKNIPAVMPSSSIIINPDLLPEINFPPAHPKINMTYVCHPYIRDYYLPTDVYQDYLTDQRIHELFHILRALGAKKIKYISNSEKYNSSSNSNSQNVGATGNIQGVNVKSEVNHQSSSHSQMSNLSNSDYELLYIPEKKPFLPDNLIWYHHEAEWQRIVNDRLNGNLLTIKTFIKRNQFDLVSADEQTQINTEFKALNVPGTYAVNVGLASSSSNENQSSQQILIEVEFADVNTLK